jgi:alanine-glyoxylate transaminase/serine-glyoxylate transaminase/serine-pyruvate transaminase
MLDETLTMIPGPTPVHPRILAALARPTISHLAPATVEAFREALRDFRTLCRSDSAQPVIVSGGGTLAMEMALVNLVRPGERLLVISQGYFGDRYGELASAFGIEVEMLQAEWGSAVRAEEVARALSRGAYRAVTMTHVDTSTGTCAPVEEYCALLRGREAFAILDGVCATGGVDERFDEWGVDVLLTAPQKAIAAPPGLALCLFSERAVARRRQLGQVPAYYADLQRWLPIMADPARYFSTPPVNELFALQEALAMALGEGLERRFARHRTLAAALRAGLATLGLDLFTGTEWLAPTLSVLLFPPGVEDARFRHELAARGVVVAGGLGAIAGRAFRLGHMGNIAAAEVACVLQAMEDALAAAGARVVPGSALAAAAPHLAESEGSR